MSKKTDGLYLVHISIHGLIRGGNLELGRDADTGGQCKYVLELVEALAEHERVGKVDLLTRQVIDPKVSVDYANPVEILSDGVSIKRIAAGPRRYLRKESLWRYLDAFIDQSLVAFRKAERLPDLIHAHYADAGYVGSRLASLLGCPFVFTGHSLGRTKRQSLLENSSAEVIERRYNLNARIEAEERALEAASLVCTSTQQEIESQYGGYEHYDPARMRVIPPGVDLSRFATPEQAEVAPSVVEKVERFLNHPERPTVLAIARADEKKNLRTLVKAFGESETLRNQANLVILAGNRDRIADLNPGARKVWNELLQLIDQYDLYGSVAIPKQHESDEVPSFYRYAAAKKGVFVNCALTEGFGLTLIEAAASGVPILATNDGGPRDIIGNCSNGKLIDPLDVDGWREALEQIVTDRDQWQQWSENGLKGVRDHYSWKSHVDRYMEQASGLIDNITHPDMIHSKSRTAIPLQDRMIFTGLNDELMDGDAEAIAELREMIESNHTRIGFGLVTGRTLDEARRLIAELNLPSPDVYITQLGARIHYGSRFVEDTQWTRHLSDRWKPDEIREVMDSVDGLTPQPEADQHRFKISYFYDGSIAPSRRKIQRMLRERKIPARVMLSDGAFLDIVPLRSGKGHAVRYVAMRWDLPFDRVLFYARRGSDHGALSGHFLSVLGADHAPELERSEHLPRVYLAQQPNFRGLIEGIHAYQFTTDVRVPESAKGTDDPSETDAVLSADIVAHCSDNE
ncbi:HAD family hydrolase [Sulfuriroseicoccus oceanibius]|uniref:sucrose-phosphate synthase n=1 Tax=Sulfuriroseicoccus oceanibius TaxID=2707525 RepID=A0A6B3LC70_9BACT|nr:HAD family hydrolase [Sulfuriroseicoccus oceanibius]QQL45985.1 glycosyltransferase [Sulfuriroseicoccus oceanibius]